MLHPVSVYRVRVKYGRFKYVCPYPPTTLIQEFTINSQFTAAPNTITSTTFLRVSSSLFSFNLSFNVLLLFIFSISVCVIVFGF